MFWPEGDAESARHSLDQLLYEARRSLGKSPTVGTATLRLDPNVIECDVTEWTEALERGDLERAVAVYRGPFLRGFYVQDSPEFERWVESTREEFAAKYRRVLDGLATRASAEGRLTDAVEWWRRLTTEDRFGSRPALGLMRALTDAGDRAGALEFARVHERIIRAELESAPDPAVMAYAEMLRAAPPEPTVVIGASIAPAAPTAPASPRADDLAPLAVPVPTPGVGRTRRRAAYVAAAMLALLAIVYRASALGHDGTSPRRPTMRPLDAAAAARRPNHGETKNLAAYDLFRRGNDPVLQRSDSGVRRAIEYLEKAVALDSSFAAAYAALARTYATDTYSGMLSPTERQAIHLRGVAAASRAITLDNSLADAHAELGYLLAVGYDPIASIGELKRSIAIDSTIATVHEVLSRTYELADRSTESLAEAQRAVRCDSLSPAAVAELANALYLSRRYDEALAELGRIGGVQPPLRRTPDFLAEIYLTTHRWQDAIDVLQPVVARQPGARGLLGYAVARAGRQTEAMHILNDLRARRSAPAFAIAEVYIGLRQYDSAFVWLDRSFDDYSLAPRIMGPLFDDVRARPEFARIRQRLGLAPQSVAGDVR